MLPRDSTGLHVFLSPHPEDVILACGGLLAHLSRRGLPAVVAVPFAHLPAHGREEGGATTFFEGWGATEPWRALQEQSEHVYEALRITVYYGQYPPAPFRYHPLEKRRLYPKTWTLHRHPDPSEGDLPHRIAGEVSSLLEPGARVYVPLAQSGHVDHVLLAQVGDMLARQGYQVFHYEEFPQAGFEHAVEKLREKGWRAWILPLSMPEAKAKIQYVQEISLLVSGLFGREREVSRRLMDYMFHVSGLGYPAERYWTR